MRSLITASFFLGTHHDALDRITDFIVADLSELAPCRENRSFVEQVGEVRTGVSGCATGHLVEVNILGKGLAAGMNPKDLETTRVIRTVDGHLSIETAGTQQGGIQNIRTVGGRDDDDSGVAFKAIHFGEQLVEGLLALIISTPESCAPLTTDSIDLVDEDDARGILLGLFEQIANAACTNTDEHLNELRARDREEGNTRFASHSLGKKRFTGARRANQETALGNLGPDGREAFRILEEVNNLGQFQLGALNAGHISEGDLGGRLHLDASLALAEVHGRIATATGLGPAEQEEQSTQQKQREDQAAGRLLPCIRLTGGLDSDINVVLGQKTQEFLIWSQIHLGSSPIVLNNLGGSTIG